MRRFKIAVGKATELFMQMTFRWFGNQLDTVSLEQIKQIPNVAGIVPALHDKHGAKSGCRRCMMKSPLPAFQWNVLKA